LVRTIGTNRILLLLLKICPLALCFSIVGCSSLFYFPRVQYKKYYDPSQVALHQEEVEFETEEGIRIHAWWFQAKTKVSKGTIVFFHGNAENLTTHFLHLSWLPDRGYSYLIFDYPGYGVSEGFPSPRNTVSSGDAALRWVHKNKDPGPLIIYGQSLGGAIAFRSMLDIKDDISIKALILDSTFLSYRSLAREKAKQSWITWLLQPIAWLAMSDHYAPKDIVRRAPVPVLVIHGAKDKVVPLKFGEEIFRKSPEPKNIWIIPSGTHGDVFWAHEQVYRKKFVDYLDGLSASMRQPNEKVEKD
jgi:fermentation-respiration switch protein FrsA (DUF1100 family)